jgi:hypothetical protein
VVVSYWNGRPSKDLHKLLRQMTKVEAGSPFGLVIVCNGGDVRPLALPGEFDPLRPRVFNRENSGWNLGAWDFGWRVAGEYDHFLFLQDDCFLKRPGWVFDFEFRAENDPGIGLLGEEIMWDEMSWPFIRKATDRDLGRLAWPEGEPVHPLDTYRELMERRGVPPGDVGTHLPSLILFASRRVLEEVGGFPIVGSSYREAVACEIGISRVIASKGYRIARVKDRSFHLIGHPQWTRGHALRMQLWYRTRDFLKKLGIRRPKRQPRPALQARGGGPPAG